MNKREKIMKLYTDFVNDQDSEQKDEWYTTDLGIAQSVGQMFDEWLKQNLGDRRMGEQLDDPYYRCQVLTNKLDEFQTTIKVINDEYRKCAQERKETVQMLRNICGEYGDNDWTDDLHLADVLRRHLFNYIDESFM